MKITFLQILSGAGLFLTAAHASPKSITSWGYSKTDATVVAIDPKEHKVTFQPIGRPPNIPIGVWFWVADNVVFSRQSERGRNHPAAFKDLRVGARVLISGPEGINNGKNDGQATEVIILQSSQ